MNDTLSWDHLKKTIQLGTKVRGRVTHHVPFGIFVEIEGVPFVGLVEIPNFKDTGRMTVEEYPPVGSMIDSVILGFKESGKQIWLSMRPSQLSRAEQL